MCSANNSASVMLYYMLYYYFCPYTFQTRAQQTYADLSVGGHTEKFAYYQCHTS